MTLESLDPTKDFLLCLEQLAVLLLLEVGFRGRVLERHPVTQRGATPGEEDERRRIRGLRGEGEVQEDERVRVEMEDLYPFRDDDLRDSTDRVGHPAGNQDPWRGNHGIKSSRPDHEHSFYSQPGSASPIHAWMVVCGGPSREYRVNDFVEDLEPTDLNVPIFVNTR